MIKKSDNTTAAIDRVADALERIAMVIERWNADQVYSADVIEEMRKNVKNDNDDLP